ncbi:hypothetical protein EXIGLDRAFT_666845 [Exidia glandulosa HHB12029]|uniref:5-nitroimidazole antibiotic resistance protein n=1 Tax=Exidia glandulosa HHB12029 TaxID=1314781 RepID=A0A165NHZ0_EXIGL|nr:hypothetical protein EXIGLDRAFT_666845 [Exidia glandulosa HHB12029]
MSTPATFEKTVLNTVRRHKERADYDVATVAGIVAEAKIVHLAFVDDAGLPQCVPMLAAFEHDEESGECLLYLHGYPGGRFVKTLQDAGTPMVATATILDGYVLALSVFSHSMNYRSAVMHGVTLPFTQEELDGGAKYRALEKVVESATPGRWDAARRPSESEIKGTAVLRMRVESASAKIRTGPPKDEKADLENAELVAQTWTGVVPTRVVSQPPIASPYYPGDPSPTEAPEHVRAL